MTSRGGVTARQPLIEDRDFTLHVGDVREVLPTLEAESIDCALTSPPFYALRDYGVDGQIGLEASPDEWAAELVGVFREVRRVLKPEGTLWVECGDSYNAGTGSGRQGAGGQMSDRSVVDARMVGNWRGGALDGGLRIRDDATKPKDLMGTPWLLAFALRADGWYLRQAIIWHKPNPMPESAKDRCTTSHSYVFLLSKSPRYWFDAEAIAEPAEWARWGDQTVPKYEGTATATGWMQPKRKSKAPDGWDTGDGGHGSIHRNGREKGAIAELPVKETKNARSVWTVPTEGFPEAHFATWPQALVERIIKAGCPAGGTCLDPFMGSGTTALVARRLGRKSVGIELSPEYAAMSARRLSQLSLLAEATT